VRNRVANLTPEQLKRRREKALVRWRERTPEQIEQQRAMAKERKRHYRLGSGAALRPDNLDGLADAADHRAHVWSGVQLPDTGVSEDQWRRARDNFRLAARAARRIANLCNERIGSPTPPPLRPLAADRGIALRPDAVVGLADAADYCAHVWGSLRLPDTGVSEDQWRRTRDSARLVASAARRIAKMCSERLGNER
jgi:hypothetical protein